MITKTTKQTTKAEPGKAAMHARSGQTRAGTSARGVVRYCVHGPFGGISATRFTPAKMIEAVRGGLLVQELDDLQATLGVPTAKINDLLGISKATRHRREAGQRLKPTESDRIVRFARLMGRAVQVFESEKSARRWITAPQIGLGGEVPLDYARTELGAREVEDLLGRIESGVY